MVAMNVWPTDGAAGSVATEARWRSMGRVWAPSAVVAGAGGEMAPSLAFPNLTVQSGAAWVDGHYTELTSNQVLTATANGLAVIRFDPAANTADLIWRDAVSVPAQSPTGTWELPIAKTVASVLTDLRILYSPAKGIPGETWFKYNPNITGGQSTTTPYDFTIVSPINGTVFIDAVGYVGLASGTGTQATSLKFDQAVGGPVPLNNTENSSAFYSTVFPNSLTIPFKGAYPGVAANVSTKLRVNMVIGGSAPSVQLVILFGSWRCSP